MASRCVGDVGKYRAQSHQYFSHLDLEGIIAARIVDLEYLNSVYQELNFVFWFWQPNQLNELLPWCGIELERILTVQIEMDSFEYPIGAEFQTIASIKYKVRSPVSSEWKWVHVTTLRDEVFESSNDN